MNSRPLNAALFALLGLALALLMRRPRQQLWLCGFILPLYFPGLELGVSLRWYLVLGPYILALAFLMGERPKHFSILRGFWPLLAWATAITVVWSMAEYGMLQRYRLAQMLGLGAGQTIYKMPVQYLSFVLPALAATIVPLRAKTPSQAWAIVNGFLAGCATSVLGGVLMYITTGKAWNGESEIALGEGVSVSRLGGLSGEPKMLGAWLVVALLLTNLRFAGARTVAQQQFWFLAFLFFGGALFLTFSTSSYLALAAAMAFLALASLARGLRSGRVLLLPALVVLAGLVGMGSTEVGRGVFQRRIAERLWDRPTYLVARKEDFTRLIMQEKPWFAATGYGLGGADLEATWQMSYNTMFSKQLRIVKTPTPMQSGLRLFGDLGLIGLGLWAFAIFGWYRTIRRDRALGFVADTLLALFAATLLLSYSTMAASWALCAGLATYAHTRQAGRAAAARRARLMVLEASGTSPEPPAIPARGSPSR